LRRVRLARNCYLPLVLGGGFLPATCSRGHACHLFKTLLIASSRTHTLIYIEWKGACGLRCARRGRVPAFVPQCELPPAPTSARRPALRVTRPAPPPLACCGRVRLLIRREAPAGGGQAHARRDWAANLQTGKLGVGPERIRQRLTWYCRWLSHHADHPDVALAEQYYESLPGMSLSHLNPLAQPGFLSRRAFRRPAAARRHCETPCDAARCHVVR
jgi:hypothetical protein